MVNFKPEPQIIPYLIVCFLLFAALESVVKGSGWLFMGLPILLGIMTLFIGKEATVIILLSIVVGILAIAFIFWLLGQLAAGIIGMAKGLSMFFGIGFVFYWICMIYMLLNGFASGWGAPYGVPRPGHQESGWYRSEGSKLFYYSKESGWYYDPPLPLAWLARKYVFWGTIVLILYAAFILRAPQFAGAGIGFLVLWGIWNAWTNQPPPPEEPYPE